MGIVDAEHAEDSPGASTLLITPVACPVPRRDAGAPSLSGGMRIRLREGSLARRLYGAEIVDEEYFCSFELNPAFRHRIERSGLRFTGEEESGEARMFEHPGHPFFIGTLFQPQRSSRPERPHPLILAFARAAIHFRTRKHLGAVPSPR